MNTYVQIVGFLIDKNTGPKSKKAARQDETSKEVRN
jgi:hypothetical protein